MTRKAHRDIQSRAAAHLRDGGGLVAVPAASDLDDAIGGVAATHFGGKRASDQFYDCLTDLDFATRDRIYAAAWRLVTAHADAAFTLGAAVGRKAGGA